ncbi:hypothetical protein PsorP6_003249 [Peronosclerospora sorghi]|uniref:Uncharacterized protein n=1 Tax=Peronosclerospora sorghi TaxID=230839 RepID=A0ACC0VP88_9STRA|nr:hypothetical protein PsorP6_003249 [Peronosclerospora sorghi]
MVDSGDLWRDRNKVFVAGLPLYVDDNALYEKFKSFGEMHQSKVVYDKISGCSKGFGFVTFCDYAHALDAVAQLNQTKWAKRTLNVRFLEPKNGSSLSKNGSLAATPKGRPTKVLGPRPEGCTTIYVGNLSYDITEDILRKVFDKCGSIRAVRFAEHIQTKEFRGFGYVQFYEEGPCEAAVQFDGMVVMGRPMKIDYGTRDEAYAQARDALQKKLKKGICHKFQVGQCTRGELCKFAHVMENQDAEELLPPAEQPVVGFATPGASLEAVETGSAVADRVPTQATTSDAPVCINFQRGKCKRGAKCNFHHLSGTNRDDPIATDREEDRRVENVRDNVEEAAASTQAKEGAPVCQNFQKGRCKRGIACRFRHVLVASQGEDQELEAGEKGTGPARVTLPLAAVADVARCRNFQNGLCTRGASCRFAHTETVPHAKNAVEEVSGYQKRFQSVCYNWQRSGACARGDTCPFQHGTRQATEPKAPVTSDEKEDEQNTQPLAEGSGERRLKKSRTKEKKKRKDEKSPDATRLRKKHKTHKKHKKHDSDHDSE